MVPFNRFEAETAWSVVDRFGRKGKTPRAKESSKSTHFFLIRGVSLISGSSARLRSGRDLAARGYGHKQQFKTLLQETFIHDILHVEFPRDPTPEQMEENAVEQ